MGENFQARDAMALAGMTDQIVYLQEGDVVDLQLGTTWISEDRARAPRPDLPVFALRPYEARIYLGSAA